jgi:S-adenosylmethionine decarboxylase
MNSLGHHVMVDIVFEQHIPDDDITFGQNLMYLMRKAVIENSLMRITHEKLVILGDTDNSPPGFSGILMLDESHFSVHAYSEKRMLAVDCFTCGGTNPDYLMNSFIVNLLNMYPSLRVVYRFNHPRFHYL